jgi:DNA primase
VDAVEEVKRKLDLVEYIGRTTKLQKAGRSFRGLCPFHTEKTPSFHVFPDRASWRCFGSCGEGGDLFSFVQKRDNADFRTALRTLAAEAGVQLSAESAQRRSQHDRLAAVVSAAVDYYQKRLDAPGGEQALRYLLDVRGLSLETIAEFRLGWAPDEWRGLRDYLHGRGYEEAEMLGAGLLVEREDGREPYDRFRGRVIVPIADERGEFIGMGGRGLHGEEPKYLNSPQSELFDKGRTLFALDHAGAAIRASGTAVVVEGYMDVLGPWQAGFRNVVATMGTSLTEHHAALLRRYARRVVLAMDPDAAGLAAAERAGGLFIALDSPDRMAQSARSAETIAGAHDIELRVAPLPPGKDPDEIARDEPTVWAEAIAGAPPYADFLLRRLMGPHAPDSPGDARRIVDRLRPVLTAVRDPVERAVYVQRIARHLGVNEDAVLERARAGSGSRSRNPSPGPTVRLTPEETLLAMLLRFGHLRRNLRNYPEGLFTSAIEREVFHRWLREEDFHLAPADDPIAQRALALATHRLPPLSQDEAWIAVQAKLRDVLRDRIILHQAARTEEIAEAEKTLGANHIAELSNDVWRGAVPTEESRELAEMLIEDLQLGLSIHRHEVPGEA